MRGRNAQRARGRHDLALVLGRHRQASTLGAHFGPGRRAGIVDHGLHFGARQIDTDGARAAQGLAPGAGHRDAEHAVGQAVSLGQRPDVQRDQAAAAVKPVDHLAQADPARAAARAQLDGNAVAGVFQRTGQLIGIAAVLRHIDDEIALAIDQPIDHAALAVIDHDVARGQARIAGQAQAVLARDLGADGRRGQGRVLRGSLGDGRLLGAIGLGRGRGLRRLLRQLHAGDAYHGIGIDRRRPALIVQLLVARGIGQVVLVALGRGVELGHIAELGQRHGAAVHVREAQRLAVDRLHHIDMIVGQPGQHPVGAQVDHHLVAGLQAVSLGQRQAAIGVEHGAGRIVDAETLQGAAHRGAAEIHQIALAVAQLERHLAIRAPDQIAHVIGHPDLEHVLALAQDAVGQHILDLPIGQRAAVDDGRAFLQAVKSRVDDQAIVGAVQADRGIRAVVGLQIDAGGLLHAHMRKAHARDRTAGGEGQRLAAQGVFLRGGQLYDGLSVRRLAPDDVIDAVGAQARAVG